MQRQVVLLSLFIFNSNNYEIHMGIFICTNGTMNLEVRRKS